MIDTAERCYWCGSGYDQPAMPRCGVRDRHRCGKRHNGAVAPCELTVRECKAEEAAQRAERVGAKVSQIPLRWIDVRACLLAFHKTKGMPPESQQWWIAEQFRASHSPGVRVDGDRFVDLLAVNTWTGRGCSILAYEVKVDRGDFRSEVRNPEKREAAMRISSQFYFAAPRGLVKPEEVPVDTGLVECWLGPRGGKHAEVTVPAPDRGEPSLGWLELAAVIGSYRKGRVLQ